VAALDPFDPDALDQRDPALIARVLPVAEAFGRTYFRLGVEGREHVPRGPVLFVGNHNGGILGPDLFCTLPVLWRLLSPEGSFYALAHDFAMRQLTPLGRVLQKLGALRACRENTERVLTRGGQVLVYPGGDLDACRSFGRRNEVVLLPRTGFLRVAQAMGVPIVPVVAHGAHRSAIIFHEGEAIARLLRMPAWARLERFPLALALPWGLARGPWTPYAPLPFRIRLRFLPPLTFAPDDDPRDGAHEIQRVMQAALDELAS